MKLPGIMLFLFLLAQCVPGLHTTTANAAPRDQEYKLKAAFLLNFARFTSWPKDGPPDQVFRFCILGEDPFGSALAGIAQKTIAGRQVELFQTLDIAQAEQCQLIYVSDSERGRVDRILQVFNNRPVLLVSDIEGFAAGGGIIELVPQGNRLGFIINHSQAREAGLKLSASLLNLASKVL